MSQQTLFPQNDVQVHKRKPAERVDEQACRSKQQHFAEKKDQDSDIHRISNIPIKACNDELLRMIDRQGNPATARSKLPESTKVDRRTETQRNKRDEWNRTPRPRETSSITPQDQGRDEHRYGAGNNDCEEHGF